MHSIATTTDKIFSQHMDDLDTVQELVEDEVTNVDVPIDLIKCFNDLLDNMKLKFHDENTTKDEKIQLLTLLPLNWQYNDIVRHFDVSNYMIKLSKKLQITMGPMSKPACAKKGI